MKTKFSRSFIKVLVIPLSRDFFSILIGRSINCFPLRGSLYYILGAYCSPLAFLFVYFFHLLEINHLLECNRYLVNIWMNKVIFFFYNILMVLICPFLVINPGTGLFLAQCTSSLFFGSYVSSLSVLSFLYSEWFLPNLKTFNLNYKI